MSRIISVVTAVDPYRAQHLQDTWESLRSQKLPEDWDFEWLVQCDSTAPEEQELVRAQLPIDEPRLSYAASRHSGPGIARTMTLARAQGRLVKTLDADDRLTPGALSRDIEAHSHKRVVWSASKVLDEYPDGRREPHYPWDPPHGLIRAQSAYLTYRRENRILVHPATLCVNYDILLALGGWMSLPASEDTALMMALDASFAGWFIDEVGMIYRRWAPQMSASAEHADPYELETRRILIKRRAEILSDIL